MAIFRIPTKISSWNGSKKKNFDLSSMIVIFNVYKKLLSMWKDIKH